MAGCSLVAPELTSLYNGARPIFSFADDNQKYFGIQATYLSSGTTCSYNAGESFIPVIENGGYTATCSFNLGDTESSMVL